MIGVLSVERSYPPWEATYAAWPGMGTICGTLTQAQTGCPVLTFTFVDFLRWFQKASREPQDPSKSLRCKVNQAYEISVTTVKSASDSGEKSTRTQL